MLEELRESYKEFSFYKLFWLYSHRWPRPRKDRWFLLCLWQQDSDRLPLRNNNISLINAIATLINKVLPVTDTWALRNSAVRPPADTEVVDVILSRKEEDLLRNMVLGRPEGRPNEDVLCLTKVKCRIPGKRIFSVLVAFEQRQGEGGSNGTHGG